MMRLLLLLLALVGPAAAHAPESVDESMADWFRSLRTSNNAGCCGEKDCRLIMPPDVKIERGTYWVRDLDFTWLQVPDTALSKRSDNPTGKYVACIAKHFVVCFVLIAGA